MNMHPALAGAVKSKTVWIAIAIEILSNVAPALPEYLGILGLNAHTIQVVGSTCGLLMLILRTVTTSSLAAKAIPTVNPPE